MKYIKLRNGISVPQIGLGVYQTPAGADTENSVIWALEAGYAHIDAAKIYGNEEGVGTGVKKSGLGRSEIFITTKLWNEDVRQRRTAAAFKESLDALGTDYIDLYLIHWPAEGYQEAWWEMEWLYEGGKIDAIGVSNFQQHHLEQLEKTAGIMPMVNQVESHPYFNNQELIDYCLSKNIAVEVWSPLGGTGGNLLEDTVLNELAEKYQKTAAQIVIRWDIQRGVIVLPKSTHKERISSNIGVFDFHLTEEDMNRINGLDKNQRVGPDPDNFNF